MCSKRALPGLCWRFAFYFLACKHLREYEYHNSPFGGVFCKGSCQYTDLNDYDPSYECYRVDGLCADCTFEKVAERQQLDIHPQMRDSFIPGTTPPSPTPEELKNFRTLEDFPNGSKQRRAFERNYGEVMTRYRQILSAHLDDLIEASISKDDKPSWGPGSDVRERYVKRWLRRRIRVHTKRAEWLAGVRNEQLEALEYNPKVHISHLPWILAVDVPDTSYNNDLVISAMHHRKHKCKICKDILGNQEINGDPVQVPCGHQFHSWCLNCHFDERIDDDEVKIYVCPNRKCQMWFRDVRIAPPLYEELKERELLSMAAQSVRLREGETPDEENASSEFTESGEDAEESEVSEENDENDNESAEEEEEEEEDLDEVEEEEGDSNAEEREEASSDVEAEAGLVLLETEEGEESAISNFEAEESFKVGLYEDPSDSEQPSRSVLQAHIDSHPTPTKFLVPGSPADYDNWSGCSEHTATSSVQLARTDSRHRIEIPSSPALASGVPSIPDSDLERSEMPFLDSDCTPIFTPEPDVSPKSDPVKQAGMLAPPPRNVGQYVPQTPQPPQSLVLTRPKRGRPAKLAPPERNPIQTRSRSITPAPTTTTPATKAAVPRKFPTSTERAEAWATRKKAFPKVPDVDVRESQAYLKRKRGKEEVKEDVTKKWVGGTGRRKKPKIALADISPASPPKKRGRKKKEAASGGVGVEIVGD